MLHNLLYPLAWHAVEMYYSEMFARHIALHLEHHSSSGLCTCFHFLQKKAVEYIRKIATSEEKRAKHLLNAAQYNLGRAYFQGYGVERQSDAEAER